MTTLAQDTFQRANQSGWGAASDGESWTVSGASSTQSIASNKGIIASTGGSDTHNQLGTQTAGDQDILCRIAINNSGDVAGIQARFSTAGGFTAYKLLYYANDLHINKVYLGNNTPLMSYGGYTLTPGNAYWFRLRCLGTSIAAMVWPDSGVAPPVWLMSLTDLSIASGGFAVLASSGAGAGVQFDHFSVSTISSMTETAMVLDWIYSTLAGDTTLQGYAPGGVWRSEVPTGTDAAPTPTPYVVVTYQPQQSQDVVVFQAVRAYSELYFEVVIVGPVADWETLVSGAARIDQLITTKGTAVTGGTISGYRVQPIEVDPLVAGEIQTDTGGVYKYIATVA